MAALMASQANGLLRWDANQEQQGQSADPCVLNYLFIARLRRQRRLRLAVSNSKAAIRQLSGRHLRLSARLSEAVVGFLRALRFGER